MRCHLCHHHWTSHADDCRIHTDLPRLRKVLRRLTAEGRQAFLQDRIRWYLALAEDRPALAVE